MRNLKRTLTGPIARGSLPSPLSGGPGARRANILGDGVLALAEMIHQADRDTSTARNALHRLLMSSEYGQLWWGMRDLGEYLRREAARNLYAQYRDTYGIVPDPRAPLPYSARTLLLAVCRDQGLERLTMNDGLRRVAEDYAEHRRMIYAWIQTYEDNRPPTLVADPLPPGSVPAPIHEDRWTWQAAQTLGVYWYSYREFHGAMAPGRVILPPDPHREPTLVPLAHQFAKALLNLDPRCPANSYCQCNWILDLARRVPAAHPQQTGDLKLDDLSRRRAHDTPRPLRQSAPLDPAPHLTPEDWRRDHGVTDDLDSYDEPPRRHRGADDPDEQDQN